MLLRFATVALLIAFPASACAALTNLAIGNFDFEDTSVNGVSTPGIVDDLDFEAEYSQWSTGNNSFEILAEGSDGAPTTFSDGSNTGQSLEIRGGGGNGQITLIVSIPNDPNILPGSAAELRFEAWSQDDGSGSYDDSGTVRVRVNNVNQTTPGVFPVNSDIITTPSSAWTLNTIAFNVNPGDTVNVQWRDSGPNNNNFGLRIDNVQLLVDIIPEPGHVAAVMLGVLMLFTSWRKRIRPVPALR